MFGTLLGDLRNIAKDIGKFLDEHPLPPPKRKVVTLRDIIDYFVKNQPLELGRPRGVVIRQRKGDRILLVQCFVDAAGEVLTRPDGSLRGRKLLTAALDAELAARFAGNDVLIFEEN
jgi:hypothetical protein